MLMLDGDPFPAVGEMEQERRGMCVCEREASWARWREALLQNTERGPHRRQLRSEQRSQLGKERYHLSTVIFPQ